MTWVDIIQLLIGSGGLLGIGVLFFKMGRFAEKVDGLAFQMTKGFAEVDKRFGAVDKRFDKIECDINDIKENTKDIEIQLGILETRVEERTMRPNYEKEPVGR